MEIIPGFPLSNNGDPIDGSFESRIRNLRVKIRLWSRFIFIDIAIMNT